MTEHWLFVKGNIFNYHYFSWSQKVKFFEEDEIYPVSVMGSSALTSQHDANEESKSNSSIGKRIPTFPVPPDLGVMIHPSEDYFVHITPFTPKEDENLEREGLVAGGKKVEAIKRMAGANTDNLQNSSSALMKSTDKKIPDGAEEKSNTFLTDITSTNADKNQQEAELAHENSNFVPQFVSLPKYMTQNECPVQILSKTISALDLIKSQHSSYKNIYIGRSVKGYPHLMRKIYIL